MEPSKETLRELFVLDNFDKSNNFSLQSVETKTFKGRITWSHKKSDLNVMFGEFKECEFSLGNPDFCKVKLRIFPCGKTEATKNFVSFSLNFLSTLPDHSGYHCALSFIDDKLNILKSNVETGSGKDVSEIRFDCVADNKNPDIYVNGKLIVQCYIQISLDAYLSKSDYVDFSVHGYKFYKLPPKKCIEKIPSDATIEVENEDIPINRALLIAEIPSLKVLFKGVTTDDNKFKLRKRIKASVFKDVLNFIYTKQINFSSLKHVCEIYDCACYLDIKNLKDICAAYMGGNLSNDTICCVQAIAEKCKDEELLAACYEYICKSDPQSLAHSSISPMDKK